MKLRVPPLFAAFMLLYVFAQRAEMLDDYLHHRYTLGTPEPSSIVSVSVQLQNAVFVFWLILSYFVFRGRSSARYALVCSALVLAGAQFLAYTDMVHSYPTHSITWYGEALELALPHLLVMALLFTPAVASSFQSHTHDATTTI